MPLTALLDQETLVDGSACTEPEWALLYKVRPRRYLTCRECGGRMRARVSSRGLRHFAHDADNQDCSYADESDDHRTLKSRVAELLRGSGHEAEVEALPQSGDRERWRADVMTRRTDGRRIAVEVQVSPMTAEEARDRTDRYARDGIETVWLARRRAPWVGVVPTVRVEDIRAESPVIDWGLMRLAEPADRGWVNEDPIELIDLLVDVLEGEITTLYFHEPRFAASAVRPVSRPDDGLPPQGKDGPFAKFVRTDAEAAHGRAMTYRKEAEQRELQRQAAQSAKVIEDGRAQRQMASKQQRVLERMLKSLSGLCGEGEYIWMSGDRWYRWNWHFPVSLEWMEVRGDPLRPPVLSIGTEEDRGTRMVVLCPAPSRCNRRLGVKWEKEWRKVVVETPEEARAVAAALGWPVGRVDVCGPEFTGFRE